MSDLSMLINGLKVTAEKNATFERRNPLDGTVATRAPAATGRRVMAGGSRRRGLRTWSETGPNERRGLLLKAADKLEAKRRSSCRGGAAETGATGMWAGFNVMLAAGMIREAASHDHAGGGRGDPVGRAGLSGHGHAPAGRRGAGHCAVERTHHPGRARHCHAAGLRQHGHPEGQRELPAHAPADRGSLPGGRLPAGVVNYITNAPADAGAVVEAMVAHPAVRRVNFTGSTKVGRIIAMTCAKYLKPVVLELGGKAPLVVLDDADIDDAVNGAAFGCFANSGQICMSTERIIVDQKIADEFVKRFADKARNLPWATRASPTLWCWAA
jgi:benzaldehyde dehydrogenase (NAD)